MLCLTLEPSPHPYTHTCPSYLHVLRPAPSSLTQVPAPLGMWAANIACDRLVFRSDNREKPPCPGGPAVGVSPLLDLRGRA